MVAEDAPDVGQANSSGQSSGLTQAVNDICLSDTTLANALDENHCGLTQGVAELSLSNEGHEEDNVTVQLVDEISTSMGRLETYTDLETEELFNRCFETVPEVPNESTDFTRMWRQIVDRPCRLYDLPSGRIGKLYVILLQ